MKYPKLDLSTIVPVDFPKEQYYPVETHKTQICLHHTASGRGVEGDWRSWLSNPERVATCVIIDADGKINQLYSSKHWGHHLGVQEDTFNLHKIQHAVSNNQKINQACIGIEIDSWGPLVFHDGAFRGYLGTKVPVSEVETYATPYKTLPGDKKRPTYFYENGLAGQPCFHYQKYSKAQITSTAQLLEYWSEVYGIPLHYNDAAMWAFCLEALKGEPGIYTHNSYRSDKQDIHPQPDMIEMLKSLA